MDGKKVLPLAIYGLVEDGIDDVAIKATKTINGHQGRMSEEPKELQIIGGLQYKICLGSAINSFHLSRDMNNTMNAIESA